MGTSQGVRGRPARSQDSLSIEPSSAGSGEEEVEIQILTASPKSPPQKPSKTLRTSRLFSLLDNELQPGLEAPTDDESTVSQGSLNMTVHQDYEAPCAIRNEAHVAESPLLFFTEEMSSYMQCVGTAVDTEEWSEAMRRNMATMPGAGCPVVYALDDSGHAPLCAIPCGTAQMCSIDIPPDSSVNNTSSNSNAELFPSGGFTGCTDISLLALRQNVTTDIAGILGSTSSATEDWISSLWLQAEVFAQMEKAQRPTGKSAPSRKPQNRCAQRKVQTTRLRQLWSKWHGCSAPDISRARVMTTCDQPLEKAKSVDDTSPLLQHDDEVFDLGYDSDPGIFIHSLAGDRMPKEEHVAQRERSCSLGDEDISLKSSSSDLSFPSIHGFSRSMRSFDSRISDSESHCLDTGEEDDVATCKRDNLSDRERVKELMMQKRKLRYHPAKDEHFGSKVVGSPGFEGRPCSGSSSTPVSVEAWFELGTRLSSKVIQPKFVWKESFEPELRQRQRLALPCGFLDLLAIVRILKPTSLDREEFPFVILDHAIVVHSLSGDVFVFEAGSSVERDCFIDDLKLTVARFASMIVVGDDTMFLEFFSPWAYQHGFEEEPLTIEPQMDECGAEESVEEHKSTIPSFLLSTTAEDQKILWGTRAHRNLTSPDDLNTDTDNDAVSYSYV